MGLFSLSSRAGSKNLFAKVSTMDADLEKIAVEPDWTGRQLYDTVCKQEVPKQGDGSIHFLFLVKFYPEDVEEELIQDITRHLFFLQIKQSILSMQLYCSAEASVLLASYAVQAIQGDCSEDSRLELSELLPECVIKQYDMSAQMWQERIRRWWANNAGQSREDAEMEYLRVAQDLEMYGIQYYPICNSKETDLNLGVSAQGIGIYKESNRITPRPFFSWSEIKNISFKNKLFTMRTMDKSTITFRAKDMSINMSILDLCIGTHNLYLRRRQPDLLEVQQMKAQAKEQRIRRIQEQNRLTREREQRLQAESDRDRYKNEFNAANEELCALREAMKKTDERAQLLAEKARVSEEEALVLSKRASEAEAECQRMKISQIKSEETKMTLERKARDAELVAHRLLQETERRNREAFMYRSQFLATEPSWPQGWYSAYALPCAQQYASSTSSHHHLMSSSSSGDAICLSAQQQQDAIDNNSSHSNHQLLSASHSNNLNSNATNQFKIPLFRSEAYLNGAPPDPSNNQLMTSDLTALRSEVEKSRAEYNEKTKQLKQKMSEFRAEIENLKVEDRQTEHDRIHASNVQKGMDKYSTLRKVYSFIIISYKYSLSNFYDLSLSCSAAGSTKSRVQVFEGL
ncbi:unnamed protein product [Anisakis simplex]|uniref:Moesin/ezrin/radixin homolog 1 n=1 Tax=Anisakis simplex TaxID=6269 RepID=A0A0M3JRM8_ANISI|nr:unnamed protein product [Anisakis simplex]